MAGKEFLSLMQMSASVKKTAASLFSQGAFAEKQAQAKALSEMPGLDFFSTAVPWQIVLGKTEKIPGYSENLNAAARDITSWLTTLAPNYSPDHVVVIKIDQARLPKPRRSSSAPSKKAEG